MDGFTFKQRPLRRPAWGAALYRCCSPLAEALSGRVGHVINFSCRPGSGPCAPRQSFGTQPLYLHSWGSFSTPLWRGTFPICLRCRLWRLENVNSKQQCLGGPRPLSLLQNPSLSPSPLLHAREVATLNSNLLL